MQRQIRCFIYGKASTASKLWNKLERNLAELSTNNAGYFCSKTFNKNRLVGGHVDEVGARNAVLFDCLCHLCLFGLVLLVYFLYIYFFLILTWLLN